MKNKIRILLIDDNDIFCGFIRVMLASQNDIREVICIAAGENVQEYITGSGDEVIMLDMGLVNKSSILTVASWRKSFPRLGIIGAGIIPDKKKIREYLKAGFSGFIRKEAALKEFMDLIKASSKGKQVTTINMKRSIIAEVVKTTLKKVPASEVARSLCMTGKEKKIIRFVSNGLSNTEIGQKLTLTEDEVRTQVIHILEKLLMSTHVQEEVSENVKTKLKTSAAPVFAAAGGSRVDIVKAGKNNKSINF